MPDTLRVPVLPAGDFRLRPWRMEDLPLVREASTDPYIPQLTSVPADYSEQAGREFVQRQWARAEAGVGYPFVIADARDDRPLGVVSLRMKDAADGRANVGYWLAPSARGRGAALAAVRTLSVWAIDRLGLERLELTVEPWNTASARTAERAGYRAEGLMRSWQRIGGKRCDMTMYSLLPSDLKDDADADADTEAAAG